MNPGISIPAQDMKIRITNIDSNRGGMLVVMLFSHNGFPKDHSKAIAVQSRAADSHTLEFDFPVTLNEFAIKVHHDEDSNGKVNKNWTGLLPAEGLGFSNGATVTFGPPSFKKAKLRLSDVTSPLIIPVSYP